MTQRVVEQHGDLSGRGGDRLGFADRAPTTDDRMRPSAVSLRPTVVAASRNNAAARLADRRVRDDSTLPPDILLLGARQSQEVKCFAVGQAVRSVPHSPISLSASEGPSPWIWVRSTPSTQCSAARTSKAGALTCFVMVPRWRQLADRSWPLRSVSAASTGFDLARRSRPSWLGRCRRGPAPGPGRRHAPHARCRPEPRGSSRLRNGSDVAVGSQDVGIALARHNGANDPHPGRAGDVGDDVMQLEVHLHQRLLHVLDVRGGIFQQPLPLAQICAQRRYLAPLGGSCPAAGRRSASCRSHCGIADVGFAARARSWRSEH